MRLKLKRAKVLVTPSAYKGSLSSTEVAQAIKAGLEMTNRPVDITCLPLADGGDGTLDSIMACLGGELHSLAVLGPLNNPVTANWLVLDNWILIELANCCGLATIINEPLKPLLAHTYGLGQLISACLSNPHKKILIGLGGSASTDGGSGALSALGVKFLDAKEKSLPLGGGFLSNLQSIDLDGLDKRLKQKEIEILTDVRSPLLGEEGASAIFAAQKGANIEEVGVLEKGLTRLAEVVQSAVQTDLKDLPGCGAAGGTAFGLTSLLKAKIFPGFAKIAELIGLQEEIKKSDLVITAEGQLDSQSVAGKATGELAFLCKNFSKPLIVFPALIEDKVRWEEFGISGVYPTAKTNEFSLPADIVETVRERMADCKYF